MFPAAAAPCHAFCDLTIRFAAFFFRFYLLFSPCSFNSTYRARYAACGFTGQVTFVSVASESRKQQQLGGGAGVLPPQHLQQLPLGNNAHYQQQLQQQLLQQQAVAQWPMATSTAATAGRADVTSPYGTQAALNTTAAALPATTAAATNPYMQQITAALMPQLYMHHYQQQYLASTQANAAAAGATSMAATQQQQQKLPHLQHMQQQ